MALKWKILLPHIYSFKNGARGLFFATNANPDNSSVELEVLLEKGKFIIKDSILTRINEEGKKEELVEDAKLPGSKFYYGASHAKTINQFYNCILQRTRMIMFMQRMHSYPCK